MGWTGFTVSDNKQLSYFTEQSCFQLRVIMVCEPLLRVGYYSDPTTRNT